MGAEITKTADEVKESLGGQMAYGLGLRNNICEMTVIQETMAGDGTYVVLMGNPNYIVTKAAGTLTITKVVDITVEEPVAAVIGDCVVTMEIPCQELINSTTPSLPSQTKTFDSGTAVVMQNVAIQYDTDHVEYVAENFDAATTKVILTIIEEIVTD